MEDVVLHYRPGSASGLGALLQRTEKLLETFPRRPPPVFSPWFPSAAGCLLPIKPAKPPPIITYSSVSWTRTAENRQEKNEESHADKCTGTTELPHENPQAPKDIPESPDCFPPTMLSNKAKREITRPSRHKDSVPITDSPVRRCWSVFKQKGVLLRRSQPLSKHFHHMVTVHRLHLHQRVKWVISQHNCGTSRDIEQVGIMEQTDLCIIYGPARKVTHCI